MKDLFLIVDGNSLMHRAFHALPLMDADGVYTNAVFGFLNMLIKVIQDEGIRYLAVCFDEHGPTFRHEIYPEYKAGRSETPEELKQQFKTIRELLDDMGIQRFSIQGWEADDLLGTLSVKGKEAGVLSVLLTGDRDALQLVNENTQLMFTRKGISETIRFTPEKVMEEYGFSVDQVTDWKGLAGDSSDNIPGVPGVGDKTAVKLLQEYGSLEKVLENADHIKGKLGEKLKTWEDQAKFCKALATIHCDAPVDFSLEACRLPDWQKAVPALKKLKLFSIIRRLTPDEKPETHTTQKTDISFEERIVISDFQELDHWIDSSHFDEICVHMNDTSFFIAGKNGKQAEIPLGGDLLVPGMALNEILSLLSPFFKEGKVVVHNVKRWLHVLSNIHFDLPDSFVWDTMIGAYLLNPQEKSYMLTDLTPNGGESAGDLCNLWLQQRTQVETEHMLSLMKEIEMPLSFTLFHMEKEGILVDADFLRELGSKYRDEIAETKRQVIEHTGGESFNLNSTQQLGEVLFEKLKLPHGKKTSKGYSTSAEVLEGLRFDAPDVIEPLLRYRQLTKLNGTYVEGLLPLMDSAGRVHTTFDQVGTATGRISSSDPNLQNIPVRTEEGKQIRKAFIPRKGWMLLDADYSQIELRLMAHFSGDPALINAFRNGEDIHTRTASEIFDVPLEWVTPELRSRAKAVNFGLIYGISGFGLSRNTGVSRREAENFIEKYFETYPGVKKFMDEAASRGARLGYAETLMGRRRLLPELKSAKAQIREFGKRVAMNTPIQGTAADIIKLAMIRVDEKLRKNGLRSRLIVQVHDELLLECPPEELDQAAALLKEEMEQVISLSVPLVAEVHWGNDWAEAK